MLEYNLNALDLLKQVVQKRNWHGGLMDRNVRSKIKTNLKKGLVTYKRACEVLELIGYEKTKDEIWAKK